MQVREQAFLDAKIKKLTLSDVKHHILLCCHQSVPKCSTLETSVESWDFLKKRIIELNLTKQVYRTRSNCFQVCYGGPIMVVYPDGIWYRSCTKEVIERILQEHIIQGFPVKEYMLHNKFLHCKNITDCKI